MPIFTDQGANRIGARTRYFRDAKNGGVEWIFAADHAPRHARSYGFGPAGDRDITALRADGMPLELLQ